LTGIRNVRSTLLIPEKAPNLNKELLSICLLKT
jgi:hypothetical protein